MNQSIFDLIEAKYKKDKTPQFRIGDTVSVFLKIREGEKERIQKIIGVVISRKGRGLTETFIVRRIVANQGVERIFMLHSPLIDKIEVLSSGKVRRAKLYYLRDRIGKARKLRKTTFTKKPEHETPSANEPPVAEPGGENEPALAGAHG